MEAHFKILLFFTFLLLKAPAQPRLSSQAERRALFSLRSSLGISAKSWNRKANPCLNWTGIECNDKGQLTGISLSGLRRTRIAKLNPGFDIEPLKDFTLLKYLNSSGFSLRGSIPEWLGQRMSTLEVLDLSSSSIFGSIPSSFGGLSRLRVLVLSKNSVTGNMMMSLWGELSSLSVLDLSENLLTGQIPSEVSSLVNLTRLDLSSNFLSGAIPPGFGLLLSLKVLNLSNNSLSSAIPAEIGNLSQLIELDLGFNSLSGSIPQELGGLRNLKKMLVGNNELEGSLVDGLFHKLVHLEYLGVNRNYLAGEIPDSLWSLSRLSYIDVSGNNLTGSLPNLVVVDTVNITTPAVFNFSNNIFYGNLSVGSGNVSRIIDVSNNYFEGLARNYDTETNVSIFLSNNCFLSVPDQRSFEACRIFYSDRGISFGNNEAFEPPLIRPAKRRKRFAYVMVGVFGGLGLIVILTAVIFLLLRLCDKHSENHQQRQHDVDNPNVGDVLEAPPKVSIDFSNLGEKFTYEQMLSATFNFSSEYLIKEGHSGDLFRGMLDEAVVVKRVDLRSVRKESLMAELDLFGKAMNNRLVPLVGHCLEDEHEKFLVYKYMVNGDLSNALYRVRNAEEEDLQSLDWITRLKIAIGAAEALSYLHHECNPSLVHRDIQASSILLDDKYEVRLGSLSEVCSSAGNTHQNMISRFLRTPQTSGKRLSGTPPSSSPNTCAYDVYCFGKLLLELITGKLGISSRLNDSEAEQWLESNLPFITQYDKEQVIKIVDQSLIIDEDLLEEVWAVAIVAKSCLNPKPSRRPSMRHVLKALENPFKVVREESFSSGRLRATSSRRSWAAGFLASWRQNSSDGSNGSGQTSREIIGGLRQTERVGSRGSGVNDYSSSHKRSSSDVFPEPVEVQDVERQDGIS